MPATNQLRAPENPVGSGPLATNDAVAQRDSALKEYRRNADLLLSRAVSPKDLSRPDDGYADSSDPSAVLLGRLNRIYGISGKVDPKKVYHGNYGFILD